GNWWVATRPCHRPWLLRHHLARHSFGLWSCLRGQVRGARSLCHPAEGAEDLSSLHSPYVVSCLRFNISSHGSTGGLYYSLFLEYAPRGSLSEEIGKQGGRLDEAVIRCYSCEILRGLAYLHSQGVVHCDVKGRNVQVGSDGDAKIADMGCASMIVREDDGELSGTPMFMALEVTRGEEQGPPTGVWALGCTIIEMATDGPTWSDVLDPITAIHRVVFSSDVLAFPS
ncbi:unnamed protein product, partial [Musa textilis]